MRAGGPRSPTADGTLFGVYYAVVTQNKDDAGKARIKIRLPWLDGGGTDQTHWALLSTPMAGDKFGWYTLPDVDDVVAVMFIAGDITRPVVLGGVWSKKDVPPTTNEDGKNDFRGYKSRTGARMVLDDSSNGKVYFADKTDKNSVTVGSFEGGGAGANKRGAPAPPAVNGPAAKQGVTIASMEGEIQMTAKGKLVVDASNIEIIASPEGVDIKGQNATYDGAMNQSFGGSAAKLEGSTTQIN